MGKKFVGNVVGVFGGNKKQRNERRKQNVVIDVHLPTDDVFIHLYAYIRRSCVYL